MCPIKRVKILSTCIWTQSQWARTVLFSIHKSICVLNKSQIDIFAFLFYTVLQRRINGWQGPWPEKFLGTLFMFPQNWQVKKKEGHHIEVFGALWMRGRQILYGNLALLYFDALLTEMLISRIEKESKRNCVVLFSQIRWKWSFLFSPRLFFSSLRLYKRSTVRCFIGLHFDFNR